MLCHDSLNSVDLVKPFSKNSIVGSVYEQNSIVKNVRVDDWTAELAIIASNIEVSSYLVPPLNFVAQLKTSMNGLSYNV